MAPDRSSTLKLQNGETDESVMIFEELAPVGTVTPRCIFITTATRSRTSRAARSPLRSATQSRSVGQAHAPSCRDVAHAWKSTGAETGRMLFMYTPGRAGKLFEEMVERQADPMNRQEFGAVADRHGRKVVGPPPF